MKALDRHTALDDSKDTNEKENHKINRIEEEKNVPAQDIGGRERESKSESQHTEYTREDLLLLAIINNI